MEQQPVSTQRLPTPAVYEDTAEDIEIKGHLQALLETDSDSSSSTSDAVAAQLVQPPQPLNRAGPAMCANCNNEETNRQAQQNRFGGEDPIVVMTRRIQALRRQLAAASRRERQLRVQLRRALKGPVIQSVKNTDTTSSSDTYSGSESVDDMPLQQYQAYLQGVQHVLK
jgi:hypothetical protein